MRYSEIQRLLGLGPFPDDASCASSRVRIRVIQRLLDGVDVVYVAPRKDQDWLQRLLIMPQIEIPSGTGYFFLDPVSHFGELSQVKAEIHLDHRWQKLKNHLLVPPYADIFKVLEDGRAYDSDGAYLVTLTQAGIFSLEPKNPAIFKSTLDA